MKKDLQSTTSSDIYNQSRRYAVTKSMPFVKLDTGILDSTLWMEREQREIFITSLLLAEPVEVTAPMPALKIDMIEESGFVIPVGWYGFVRAASVGILRRAGVEKQTGMAALTELASPDKHSRSRDFEGRRMVRVDGGFIILNYMKYRDRDYTAAERQRRLRERRKLLAVTRNVSNVTRDGDVTPRDITHADEDVDAHADAIKKNPLRESVEAIYECYPKKTGKRQALKAIESAIKRVMDGEYKNEKREETTAVAGIKNRTILFAQSEAGNRGRFTPHAATWFNRSSYLDDPKEWDCGEPVAAPSKHEQRVNSNRAAILAGLGIGGKSGGDQSDLQDGDASRRSPRLEKLLPR